MSQPGSVVETVLLAERKAGKCLSLDMFMVDFLEVSDIIFDVCSRNSESLSYNGIIVSGAPGGFRLHIDVDYP